MGDDGGIPSSNYNKKITWEGCSVLLDINGGDRLVFARLSPSASVKIGDKKCSLQPLVGCPFGSLFQVVNGPKGPHLVLASSGTTEGLDPEEKISANLTSEEKDNRMLIDDNKAQSLTGMDIDEMRRCGASGEEIIEALISNSSTFEKKTMFSQEKYKLKKQKKYAPKILLRRPFSRSICEAYFKKYPNRTGFLRVDTLSLLLSMGNIGAHSEALVLDMAGGLLVGAVAERLGGTGYVCCTHLGLTPPSIDIVRMFNFGDDICSRILRASLSSLLSSCSSSDPQPNDELTSKSTPDQSTPDESTDMVNPEAVKKSAVAGKMAPADLVNTWKQRGFSSLMIAAPDVDPCTVIDHLLPFLTYSSPFVVYHPYLQPLAACMHKLQAEKKALALQISEPWLREYQVLPARTHPHMQMSAGGGYILSGIRILES
ncbi:eukaryotic initiation factor 3 gamma subunit family protein [Wolffia australiana]